MRKMEVIRKRTTPVSGGEITLVYSVTIDDMTADELDAELESYGVCIDIPEREESAAVRGITANAASIDALTGLIAENLVTPCTLSDVVYDWLCGE